MTYSNGILNLIRFFKVIEVLKISIEFDTVCMCVQESDNDEEESCIFFEFYLSCQMSL